MTPSPGAMLMVGFQGTTPQCPEVVQLCEAIANSRVGGVIFFKHNITSPDQIQTLTRALKAASGGRPLFLGIDQEGGRVQRMAPDNGFTAYPAAASVAQTLSPIEAFNTYLQMASELHSAGFNLNFGPVVDLAADETGKACPVIGDLNRSFGATHETIIPYAEAFMRAHFVSGLITCLKHYPGHGLAGADSHQGLVDITHTHDPREAEVFHKLIARGPVGMVMVGHLMHHAWDAHDPYSLARDLITRDLRRNAGYTGVVVTDDLHMGAIGQHYSLEETIVKAITAGNDLLVFSNNPKAAGGVQDFRGSVAIIDQFFDIVARHRDTLAPFIECANARLNTLKGTLG